MISRILPRLWPFAAALQLISCGTGPSTMPAEEAIRHNNLGVALMDRGAKDPQYFSEAIKEFERAVQVAPGYLKASINLGMAFYYSGQVEKALSSFEKLAEDNPDNPNVSYMLGLLMEIQGRFEEGSAHFQKVTEVDPQDPSAWYHLGRCYSNQRKYAQAVQPFERAAALAPYQRRSRYNLFMALQRSGRTGEAEAELQAFKNLETSNVRVVEAPKGPTEYLRQGKYAEAIADSRAVGPQAESPKRFMEVASQLGIHFEGVGATLDSEIVSILKGKPVLRTWLQDATHQRRLIEAVGSGVSFSDYNQDERLDLFVVNARGQIALYEQQSGGGFLNVTTRVGLQAQSFPAMACVWGDYDNDGWSDLLITGYGGLRLYHNRRGTFQDVTRAAGIKQWVSSGTWHWGAAFADVDHDGDLDIYVAGFVNLKNLTQKDQIRFPDDLEGQGNLLFRNNRDGTFREIAREAKLDGGDHKTRTVWFSDINDDRAVDVVLLPVEGKPTTFLNRKDGTFSRSDELPAKFPRALPMGESRAYADFNRDGAVDEAINRSSTGLLLNRNETEQANWLTVQLAGYTEPGKVKSNRAGIGSKVEVRTVGRWERQELRAGNGMLGCDSAEVYFNLGDQTQVDFVRALFPSGVRWTLKNVSANQVVKIEEPLLDVNSCPTLFSWNGERFAFISDTLSGAVLGELVAPNQHWLPDSDEWIRITDRQLRQNRKGILEVRFTNPLEEVTYLDHTRLLAVDHPTDVKVYPSERMVSTPENRKPIAVYALRNLRPLKGARDHQGQDVTNALLKQDRLCYDRFSLLPFKGFAEKWSLRLDLGELDAHSHPVLLLQGWSYWNSSASVLAADQAGLILQGPVLEVLGASGKWRVGMEDMGVAAGLPRTVLLDLSQILRAGERMVRISTNRTLYYDQVLMAERIESQNLDKPGNPDSLLRLSQVPLLSAELRWLGYPKRILPDGNLPEIFDYSEISQESNWGTHEGYLTRYGEVLPLLRWHDDKLVLMGHGEEVALSFDAGELPVLPEGWGRTYLFYGLGFEKGYELHSARSETVAPLPFQAMQSYPPDQDRPVEEAYWHYLLNWNTRPSFMRRRGKAD